MPPLALRTPLVRVRRCLGTSRRLIVFGALLAVCGGAPLNPPTLADEPSPREVRVRVAPELEAPAGPGRLYLFLGAPGTAEPRFGPNWFNPEPFFGINLPGPPVGEPATIDDRADGFPSPLGQLPAAKYRAQAVWDRKLQSANLNWEPGNLVSEVVDWDCTASEVPPLELVLGRAIAAPRFPARDGWRELTLVSERLSAFHGREVAIRAAAVLPDKLEPGRRYGTLYVIGGFGAGHHQVGRYRLAAGPQGADEEPLVRVFLSGDCPWGHHVFADSATNGPWATALVREFLPWVERELPLVPGPAARFVTGHSSGGWAALWLLLNHPGEFAGCWALAPDVVDFHDYQQIDLYAEPPQNMYRDGAGQRRPIARIDGQPRLWYDDFTRMDDVLAQGGQLRSFEAVFSPRGADGLPRRMYDRATGQVDPEVVDAWRAYDLAQLLRQRWPELAGLLTGKLRVTAGGEDTFYLEGAVRRLTELLRELGSDARVEVLPGASHSSFLTAEFEAALRREVGQRLAPAVAAGQPGAAAAR